jgi:hypothetical protein
LDGYSRVVNVSPVKSKLSFSTERLGHTYSYHLMYHGHGKSFWLHPRDLLGDVSQMEACFDPFGDNANLNVT